MPGVLTSEQAERFWETGFLSPIDVMSEAEAAGYLERLEAAEQAHPAELNAENRNNPHLAFTFLDELAHHPVVLDAVEDLLGPNLSLWGSVLFIKEPRSKGYVSWHQDATYMGIEPHEYVTPWIALTPSNRENGCMSMIPGSHKAPVQKHDDTFHEDNILTRGQAIPDVDESAAVDLLLRPGPMSLHHARVIHGSQPNRSERRRVGYVLQSFMAPAARQVLGKNYWLDMRGDNPRADVIPLSRPVADLDAEARANRQLANDNWAEILYQGASQTRRY